MCVAGNGASIRTLIGSPAPGQADLVIAVTNYDEVNIVCCLLAKKLGAGHTIARIRDRNILPTPTAAAGDRPGHDH